jgi:hypothetical protein
MQRLAIIPNTKANPHLFTMQLDADVSISASTAHITAGRHTHQDFAPPYQLMAPSSASDICWQHVL